MNRCQRKAVGMAANRRRGDVGRAGIDERRDFQTAVVEAAKLQGWINYHTFDSRRSVAGFPDQVLVRSPRLILAELKVGTNKLSAEQADWLRALMGCGVEVYLWRPEWWDDIMTLLAPTLTASAGTTHKGGAARYRLVEATRIELGA